MTRWRTIGTLLLAACLLYVAGCSSSREDATEPSREAETGVVQEQMEIPEEDATSEEEDDALLAGSGWRFFGGNAQRTGLSEHPGPKEPQLLWSVEIGDPDAATPVIASDGTIYVGSRDKQIHAVSRNGSILQSVSTIGSVTRAAAIGADGTICVGDTDGYVYALSATRALKWTYETGGEIWSSPAIASDGTIYVGLSSSPATGAGEMIALTPDGDLKWSFTVADGSNVPNSPTLSGDEMTVYVTSGAGVLYAIGFDGAAIWSYASQATCYSSPVVSADGTIYFGSWDQKLHSLNPDGSVAWSTDLGANLDTTPAIGPDGTIYIADNQGLLYAVGSDGQLLWMLESDMMGSPVAVANDGVVYASGGSYVTAISPAGEVMWRFAVSDPEKELVQLHNAPAIGDGGVLYVAAISGTLYAIGEEVQ